MKKPLLFAFRVVSMVQCWPMRYKMRLRCGLVIEGFISLKNRHKAKENALLLLIIEMLNVTHERTATKWLLQRELRAENHGFLKTYGVTNSPMSQAPFLRSHY